MKEILKLKPTQIAVGYQQVEDKANRMNAKSQRQLDEYIKNHKVPVVKGYDDKLFIIDHHHFCSAALRIGIDKVLIDIVADWSSLSYNDFWNKMAVEKKIWPFDEHGEEIELFQFVSMLPNNVTGLKNDPYRSIAGILRQRGFYKKDWTPFSEFYVANKLRPLVNLRQEQTTFTEEEIQLASSHCQEVNPKSKG